MNKIWGPEPKTMVPFTEIENTGMKDWKHPHILEKSGKARMCIVGIFVCIFYFALFS